MQSIDFQQRNVIIGENQPEYDNLYAWVVPESQTGEVIFIMELTDEEIIDIIKSRRLQVSQWTFRERFQPILITVQKTNES